MSPFVLWQMWRDWKSHPVSLILLLRSPPADLAQIPPPELLPPIVPVNWGRSASASPAEVSACSKDIKATWLGK